MRRLAIVGLQVWAAAVLSAATQVTVAQLREMVRSAHEAQQGDEVLAARLGDVELTERFDGGGVPVDLGMRTQEVLRVMAAESEFLAPAPALVPRSEPLSPAEQRALFEKAREYGLRYIEKLPDFICKRTTRRYDDAFQSSVAPVHGKLRSRDVLSSELRFSHGVESNAPQLMDKPTCGTVQEGLTSYGEFGSIVGALFTPDSDTKTAWSHWEILQGKQVAVFSYSVDSAHSRYTIVWCCSTAGQFKVPQEVKTAYAGELYVDPESGEIVRITRKAQPPPSFPTVQTDTAVDYRKVRIGDESYLAPVRSVIISTASSAAARFRGWLLHYVNELEFTDYQKFTANSTLWFGPPPAGALAQGPTAPPVPAPEPPKEQAAPACPPTPATTLPGTLFQATAQETKPVGLLVRPPPGSGNFRHVRFSPDGRYVLAQDVSRIEVLTAEPFRELFRIPAENASLADFTPDSKEVVFVGSSTQADARKITYVKSAARLERWSIADQRLASATELNTGPCRSQGLSPDGIAVACVGFEGTLRIFDIASNRAIFERTKVARLFESASDGVLTRWGEAGSAHIEFSPDGRYVIVSPDQADGTPVAFDLREKRVVKLAGVLKGLRYTGFVFVGPDRLLMSGLRRGIWNPKRLDALVQFPSGKLLAELDLPDGSFTRAADPAFVRVHSAGTQALDLRSGQLVPNPKGTMDIFGDHYVAARALGVLGLYAKNGRLLSSVRLRGSGQFGERNELVLTSGRVVRKGADQLVVETGDHREVTLLVRDTTKFSEGDRAIAFQDVEIGRSVDAQSEPTAAEEFRAVAVNVEAPAPPGPLASPKAAAARGAAPPDPFLDEARLRAAELAGPLPSFTCIENATRLLSNKRGDARWKLHDHVSAQLVWTGGEETYRDIRTDGNGGGGAETVRSHSWTIAEFNAVAADVLASNSLRLKGGETATYEFRIEGEESHWVAKEGGQAIRPTRTGTVQFDQKSKQLLHIEFQAVDIPRAFPVGSLKVAIDFDTVTLGPRKFLVPAQAELTGCRWDSGWCTKDSIEFREYGAAQ